MKGYFSVSAVIILLNLSLPALVHAAEEELPWGITREIAVNTQPDITGNAIACSNGIIYVVYKQNHIYLIRSMNQGKTWTPPLRVSGPGLPNGAPDILVDENNVHIAYTSRVTENSEEYFQLFHSYSRDGGETFSAPDRITYTNTDVRNPRLVYARDGVGIVYYESVNRVVVRRESIDLNLIRRLEEYPMGTVISQEEHRISRCRIRIARSVDAGRTFPRDRNSLISDVSGFIETLVVFSPRKNVITLAWRSGLEGAFSSVESEDGGETWPTKEGGTPYLRLYEAADMTISDDKMCKVAAEIKWKQKVKVVYESVDEQGSVEETKDLTAPIILTASPRIATDGNELYVVFAAITKDAARLGYVRTDHIPPESYIYEPYSPDLYTNRTTFRWQGHDDLSDHLEFSYRFVSADGAEHWSPFSPETQVSTDVSAPPPDGVYTLEVRARDEAGNVQPEPSTFEFNTYNIPPDTFFSPQIPREPVHSRRIRLRWEATDNDPGGQGIMFSHQFDRGEWTAFEPNQDQAFQSLTEGSHRVAVRSVDHRGNVDPTPAQGVFRVILGMSVEFVANPPRITNESSLRFQWVGKDLTEDNVGFEYLYRFDDGDWGPPDPNPMLNVHNLMDGTHAVEIKSRDITNPKNESPVLRHVFLVDRTPPNLEVVVAGLSKTNGYLPMFLVAVRDNHSPQSKIEVKYRYAGGDWLTVKGAQFTIDRPVKWYSPGYEVELSAADEVGNRADSRIVSLRFIDRLFSNSDALKTARRQIYLFLAITFFAVLIAILLFVFLLLQRKKAQLLAMEIAEQAEESGLLGEEKKEEDEEEFEFDGISDLDDLDIGGTSEDDDDLFG